jgi:hypothetical protein
MRSAQPVMVVAVLVSGLAMPAQVRAQSTFFSDTLTGPASPDLNVPFDKYSYTASGLQRTSWTGSPPLERPDLDRPMVKTLSGGYLNEPQFTADLRVSVQPDDVAFFGLGRGDPDPGYFNEPSNGFVLRIHNCCGGLTDVHAAAVTTSANNFGNHYLDLHSIGNYTPPAVVFRIARNGDAVTLSIPATGQSWTYSLSQYAAAMRLNASNTHLFFGNTTHPTTFSDLSVTSPTTAPTISALAPSATSIWPPNGRMVPVTVQATATGTPVPVCSISSVTSNEGSARPGGPQTVIMGPLSVSLRAERLGAGSGRIYSIAVTCTNSAGSASAVTTVTVPHDQRK